MHLSTITKVRSLVHLVNRITLIQVHPNRVVIIILVRRIIPVVQATLAAVTHAVAVIDIPASNAAQR
jgi:hypothetical protein